MNTIYLQEQCRPLRPHPDVSCGATKSPPARDPLLKTGSLPLSDSALDAPLYGRFTAENGSAGFVREFGVGL